VTPALLIFDCDGTLIDSERLYNRAWASRLARLGLDWTPMDVARRLMGRPIPDCLALIGAALGRAVPDDFLPSVFAETDRIFASEGLMKTAGIDEALAALPQLKCVASSGLLDDVRRNLETTGLLAHFGAERLFVAAMVRYGKPAPDLFLLAAERMGVAPADCMVIEDSVPGVLGARAAGMRALAYVAQHNDGDALIAAGGEPFHHMRELPDLIGQAALASRMRRPTR
jgi:HAD superfamily hydrolase (TIGR01509 family)